MKQRSSKAAKAHEFKKKAREEILKRDEGQCIFCAKEYHMEDVRFPGKGMLSIMHYVPRSRGGLGIAENGAIGCLCHHEMLDNGNKGRREEMLNVFRAYLKARHKDWNEEDLTYSKWR